MPKPSRATQRKKILILAVAALAIAALLYLATHNKTLSSTQSTDKTPAQIQQQAQDAASASSQQKTSQTGQSAQPAAATPGSGGAKAPTAPTGQFVSAHNVPSNAGMESVCNTTVGASCQIVFTRTDGTKKSLIAKTTDSSGITHWNWIASDLLSSGSWTVTAVATQNGLTSSTSDASQLVVQ